MFILLTFQVAHNQMFPFFEASRTVSRPLQGPVEHMHSQGRTGEKKKKKKKKKKRKKRKKRRKNCNST
jgi:hypothetical protein